MAPRHVEFIAHRGSSHLAPENTLAAFRLGWQETTTCELDIHATADGQLLVLHDDTTRRTTGVDLALSRHSLIEWQQFDAGSWKGPEWKGERLPSLTEVLTAMPVDKRLLIEIKGSAEVVPELARVIRASGKTPAVALHSFNLAACRAAKAALPDLPVHLLIKFQRSARGWSPTWASVLATIRENSLNGLGSNDTSVFDAGAIAEAHAAHLTVNIWTVDDVSTARRLIDLGVDGIITNRPGWLRAQLRHAA